MNPYQVLGVSPGDSEETIKRAYRKAAKECHPDTHPGDRRAEERFKALGEAYRLLAEKEKRKAYDEKERMAGKRRSSNGNVGNGRKAEGASINPEGLKKEFERFMGFKY